MSYAKLNIWLKYDDCNLITDCWRTDLVINTCCGESLFNMDLTILDQLKERYKDFFAVSLHHYQGEDRIMLQPGTPAKAGPFLQHIEVDVPPGCYVVWTRVCYQGNEETNKVMVIVGCGAEACVNLLLNTVKKCTGHIYHPLLEEAVRRGLPGRDVRGAARVMRAVQEKKRDEVFAELDRRLEEVGDVKELREPILKVKAVLGRTRGC